MESRNVSILKSLLPLLINRDSNYDVKNKILKFSNESSTSIEKPTVYILMDK